MNHYYLVLLSVVATSLLPVAAQNKDSILPMGTPLPPAEQAIYNKQKSNQDFYTRITQFSELSWTSGPFMDLGSNKGGYVFSADIAPHFFIGSEKLPFVVDFTPRYKVRLFRDNKATGDRSLPVRTPSYIPGVFVYIPLGLGNPDVYKNIRYLSFGAIHHSNGQDGKAYTSTGDFNYYNGSFGTNYFELYYNWNHRQRASGPQVFECAGTSACATDFTNGYHDWLFRVGIEQHVSTAYELRDTYSRTRLNLKASYIDVKLLRWLVGSQSSTNQQYQIGKCYLQERFRLAMNASVNMDKLQSPFNSIERRINAELGGYLRVGAANTSLFLMGGWYGNDPYNIYYSRKYAFIRAGLSLGFFVRTSRL